MTISIAAMARSAMTKCEFSLSSGLHSQLICTPCMRSNILKEEKMSSLRDVEFELFVVFVEESDVSIELVSSELSI